ncbi:hypothetical protein L2E82_14086 [Cichorium intybus]|uniref:Uncharacterized protein n=1 Tax=Cichorium intybus TaxID=13427 RepID=A0ACB9EZC4_CICIN|nr:hypothetical protein L2E82_14086 [Cichorium intybus]
MAGDDDQIASDEVAGDEVQTAGDEVNHFPGGDDRSKDSNGQLDGNRNEKEDEQAAFACTCNNEGDNRDHSHVTSNKAEEIAKDNVGTQEIETIGCKNKKSLGQIGPIENLVPLGCFGPFPSMAGPTNRSIESPFLGMPPANTPRNSDKSRIIGSSIKRRRVDDAVFNSIPCRSLFDNVDELNTAILNDESRVRPMDLNQDPSSTSLSEASGSSSNEILATIEIGTKLGFQIEEGNEILHEVMGAPGDSIDPK